MSYEEALSVLGVAEDATFREIRRAYLRLVKEHKPERDPEGFQRVREAFDLVGPSAQARERYESPELESATRASVVVETPEAEAPPAPSAVVVETPEVQAPPPPTGPEPDDEPEPIFWRPDEPDATAHQQRVEALGEDASPQSVVEIWREAVEQRPNDADAHFNLASALEEAGELAEAAEALARAARLDGEYLESLLWRFPRDIPADLHRRIEEDPWLHREAAEAFVDEGLVERARPLLKLSLKRALEDTDAPDPPVEATVFAVARLAAKGQRKRAAQLAALLSDWLDRSGAEHRVLQGTAAGRWGLIRELLELGDRVPSEVFEPVAHALATDDAERAMSELPAFQEDHPRGAAKLLRIMSRRAPGLESAYGDYLRGPSPRHEPTSRTRWPNWWLGAALLCVYALARVAMKDDPPDLSDIGRTPEIVDLPLEPLPIRRNEADMTTVRQQVQEIRARGLDIQRPELRERAAEVLAAFEARDCPKLADRFRALELTMRSDAPGDVYVAETVGVLGDELDVVCPPDTRGDAG